MLGVCTGEGVMLGMCSPEGSGMVSVHVVGDEELSTLDHRVGDDELTA